MKVHRVVVNVDDYQHLYVEDDDVLKTDLLMFDGTPKRDTWTPPEVFVLEPKLRRGNFFGFTAGALVVDEEACNRLRPLLEMSGELLPLPFKNEMLYVLNVTRCTDSLDQKKTKWEYGHFTGQPIRITEYVFKTNRFIQVPLFKIPETCRGELLSLDGIIPEDEFKFSVEANRLTGLEFVELWDSAAG